MDSLPETAIPDCVSIIVPTFNEEESVGLLTEQVAEAMNAIGCSYELIFVDDGSRDGTAAALTQLAETYSEVRVVEFRRNFGYDVKHIGTPRNMLLFVELRKRS